LPFAALVFIPLVTRPMIVSRSNSADAITAQIQAKQAAVSRYHTAFENGTMDDTTAGPRLKTLMPAVFASLFPEAAGFAGLPLADSLAS
jgi:hypothetical protein